MKNSNWRGRNFIKEIRAEQANKDKPKVKQREGMIKLKVKHLK